MNAKCRDRIVSKGSERYLVEQGYDHDVGFDAIAYAGAKILILGSLPGKASIEANEYYAKKGNQFWPLLKRIFGVDSLETYQEKKDLLKEHHIALWDVYRDGYRKSGSSDKDIVFGTTNDIKGLLKEYPTIERIVISGKRAMTAFKNDIGSVDGVEVIGVPSTSPANRKYWDEQLWRDALKGL